MKDLNNKLTGQESNSGHKLSASIHSCNSKEMHICLEFQEIISILLALLFSITNHGMKKTSKQTEGTAHICSA